MIAGGMGAPLHASTWGSMIRAYARILINGSGIVTLLGPLAPRIAGSLAEINLSAHESWSYASRSSRKGPWGDLLHCLFLRRSCPSGKVRPSGALWGRADQPPRAVVSSKPRIGDSRLARESPAGAGGQGSRVDPAQLATHRIDPPARGHAGPHQGTGEENPRRETV
jgi:hypothetical protein